MELEQQNFKSNYIEERRARTLFIGMNLIQEN